jgi:hypothetical protein
MERRMPSLRQPVRLRFALLLLLLVPASVALGHNYVDCDQPAGYTSLGISTEFGYAAMLGFVTCYPMTASSCTACSSVFDDDGPNGDTYDVIQCVAGNCEIYEDWEDVPPMFGEPGDPPDNQN